MGAARALGNEMLGCRSRGDRAADGDRRGMKNDVGVVVSEQLGRYGFGDSHPFGPDRHTAFMREFRARGLDARTSIIEPREASYEELLSFHTPAYLDLVKERSATGQGYLDAGDTPASRGIFEAAALVVGATLNATDAIMAGRCRRAFIPIAGLHHAARDRAAGFCVFNDCGVAIEQLRERLGLERIAYVDIDAHHGDGVFYAFQEDPSVIFADLHEDGRYLYPGTGAASETGKGAAAGTKLNIPMAPGSDDAAFDRAWPRVIAHLERYAPQFIIFQCGADSLGGDPITHMQYSAASHGRAASELRALADRLGHGRLLALGGGGYNRANLAQAWNAVVENLLDA